MSLNHTFFVKSFKKHGKSGENIYPPFSFCLTKILSNWGLREKWVHESRISKNINKARKYDKIKGKYDKIEGKYDKIEGKQGGK